MKPPSAGISIFCFCIMRLEGYERELVEKQLKMRVGIFACDKYAVLSLKRARLGKDAKGDHVWTLKAEAGDDEKGKYGVDGATTRSFLNTFTFIKAWDRLIEEGLIWHDWVVKVDPDTVVPPDRLRTHLAPHTGDAVYFANCDL